MPIPLLMTVQGITVLQAVEQLDAGPVWAWEQFPIDVDDPALTKSALYRGPITRAAVKAVPIAISRIVKAIEEACNQPSDFATLPTFHADPKYAQLSVTDDIEFQGGKTHHRPLLKAAQRVFDPSRHTAVQVSRCIRSADSQPGVLTKIFGPRYYVYGGQVEAEERGRASFQFKDVSILGIRSEAVCIRAADGKGVWITHLRRPKVGGGPLCPKVPAVPGLLQDGVLSAAALQGLEWPYGPDWSLSPSPTLQEIYVTFEVDINRNKVAYLYFDFYNGATSTSQCSRLIEALDYIITQSTSSDPIRAVALMGSNSYFSNGIALNVIEAAEDPALESWNNINRIDDLVHHLLHVLPSKNILTIAAIRGNAAAGGVALAAACDFVIAGSGVVLNPRLPRRRPLRLRVPHHLLPRPLRQDQGPRAPPRHDAHEPRRSPAHPARGLRLPGPRHAAGRLHPLPHLAPAAAQLHPARILESEARPLPRRPGESPHGRAGGDGERFLVRARHALSRAPLRLRAQGQAVQHAAAFREAQAGRQVSAAR